MRGVHAGVGADRRRVRQQGHAQDAEPGHRRGAGGAGRGGDAVQAADLMKSNAVTLPAIFTYKYKKGL